MISLDTLLDEQSVTTRDNLSSDAQQLRPTNTFMRKIIRITLRPFVKLLLRYGIGFGEFAQVCKELFVDVAHTDFQIAHRKQTISRVSVLTGISRREIKIIRDKKVDASSEYFSHNHAARILACWTHDVDFQDANGNPAPLPINSDTSDRTFNTLVRKHGNNTPYRAILDELFRIGAVDIADDSVVRMVSVGYLPSKASQKLLSVGMQSVADHISTINYNDTYR